MTCSRKSRKKCIQIIIKYHFGKQINWYSCSTVTSIQIQYKKDVNIQIQYKKTLAYKSQSTLNLDAIMLFLPQHMKTERTETSSELNWYFDDSHKTPYIGFKNIYEVIHFSLSNFFFIIIEIRKTYLLFSSKFPL